MVPGTAIGVLVGDLLYFALAIRLAKRTGRDDITAMPLGLDTPSTLGMVFFVLGPAFLHVRNELHLATNAAASYAWRIGVCSLFFSGIFKLAWACGGNERWHLHSRGSKPHDDSASLGTGGDGQRRGGS